MLLEYLFIFVYFLKSFKLFINMIPIKRIKKIYIHLCNQQAAWVFPNSPSRKLSILYYYVQKFKILNLD